MDSVLSEKWFKLSLVQQMVNIGNEVKRALNVLSELLISKEVLEDYRGEHNFACTGEQISGYYQAYQYLL